MFRPMRTSGASFARRVPRRRSLQNGCAPVFSARSRRRTRRFCTRTRDERRFRATSRAVPLRMPKSRRHGACTYSGAGGHTMSTNPKPYVIVVAVDYAEGGHLAFERALELAAERPSVEVHVINVLPISQAGYPDPVSGTWTSGPPPLDEAAEQLRGYVAKRAAAFREHYEGSNLAFLDGIRAHQRLEIPSEQIAQLAADVEADLVIVGTHGRRGFSRLMIG